MKHLAAFYSSVDQAGVLTALAGVTDQVLVVNGNNVRVPADMNYVSGAYTNPGASSNFTNAQLQAPSLRDRWYPDLSAVDPAVSTAGVTPPIDWFGVNPLDLVPSEDLNYLVNANPASAQGQYGLVWFSDGPDTPVQGEILTVRCTAGITLAAGTWVNGSLTFTQTLPYGDYNVVGIRAYGTGLVAARIVFPGGIWRPGTVGLANQSVLPVPSMVSGKAGNLGTFNTNVPPSLDAIGASGTAQVIYLDLVKAG